MINKLRIFVAVISLVLPSLAFVPAVGAVAVDYCKDAPADSTVCAKKGDDLGVMWKNLINTLILVVVAVSVVVVIIGGMRYSLSGGDQKAITEAKNIILYAVIGLVMAGSAYAILNWVTAAFTAK